MFDISPLTPNDQQFLSNCASLFRKATPAKNREGMVVVLVSPDDAKAIADTLERIAAFGDSGAEIERIVA